MCENQLHNKTPREFAFTKNKSIDTTSLSVVSNLNRGIHCNTYIEFGLCVSFKEKKNLCNYCNNVFIICSERTFSRSNFSLFRLIEIHLVPLFPEIVSQESNLLWFWRIWCIKSRPCVGQVLVGVWTTIRIIKWLTRWCWRHKNIWTTQNSNN